MHRPPLIRTATLAAVGLTIAALLTPAAATAAPTDPTAPAAPATQAPAPQSRTVANQPTGVSLTAIDSRTYRVTGTPHCGLFESPCQIHVGNVGGDYHWDGGTSTAVFANWRYGEAKTPEFWTYGCTLFGCKDSAHVRGNPVVRPFPDQKLTASVVRQDDAQRTVTVSGNATGGAEVRRNDNRIATATSADPGVWSATVSGLSVGWNTLVFEQYVRGTYKGQALVSVQIAAPTQPERIVGDSGSATLERAATTPVSASFTPRSAFSTPSGSIEFHAPAGTTFATGQDRQRGQRLSGGSWSDFSGDTLVSGVRSADGRTYRYSLANRDWGVANGQRFRFTMGVETPLGITQTSSSMTARLVGSIAAGSFDTTATVRTTVNDKALTARVTDVDQSARSATLEGTTPARTTDLEITWTRNGQQTTRRIQPTSPGAWTAALDGLEYGANTVRVEAFANTTSIGSTDVQVAVPRPDFSATARFDDDVDVPVVVGGSGATGSTVELSDGQTSVAVVPVRDGRWEVSLPAPDRGGVRTLRAEQRQGGQVTDRADVSIDYGAAVRITSPGDGFMVSPVFPEVLVTGRAADGAIVTLTDRNAPGVVLGRAVARDDGTWAIRTPALDDQDHLLVATARSRGANTTTTTLSIVGTP
ncbi:hypothetical protein [Curtobacterium sp. APC 4022]|uniref:hypothetical protein n=1 Tax=Curtobacterium sp. APC 4022 TaxID=3035201 RepID=UPI0025B3D6A8|nr:hypothetical protein [Curtobacterium sp. APC 4022]MDN3477800.1 hypothetical protein [Curtobacterium sp. APC 4022]